MYRRLLLALTLVFVNQVRLNAQVNGYAKVTAIAGTTLSVNNVNETFDSFEVGEYLVVMQMQGADIGSNTTNVVTFGTLNSIANVGQYEIRQISTVNETAGVPTSIVLSSALTNTYTTGNNVQVVTFPKFGSGGNYATTANITGVAWNGNVGGVVAFQVDKYLQLNHNITADGIGFRGGNKGGQDGGNCVANTNYISATSTTYGNKGEGVYYNTTAGFAAARGKIVNGGGGGNRHNAGGGGGGNYTAGGEGGLGYNTGGCSPNGGLGGDALSAYVSSSRLFMGGGGGGGQENNNVGTNGGAGGGIIIIKADSIIVTGTCAGRTISANGASTTNASNDGTGGAGAGGSIFLDVDGIRVVSGCPLTIASNGGAGGKSNNGTSHGGGGGGGQGVVIITAAGPITNTTVQTNNGAGGCNNSSTPCSSAAGSGAGSNNSGVSFGNSSGPLPVELLFFNAYAQSGNVAITWATASEQNCSHYIVYKSRDGILWTPFAYKQGAGNSNHRIDYVDYDNDPFVGANYYRLEQHDFDGTTSLSNIAVVYFEPEEDLQISVFPNPANDLLNIRFNGNTNVESIECFDVTGRIVRVETIEQQNNQFTLPTHQLEPGNYFVRLTYGTKVKTISFIVTHE